MIERQEGWYHVKMSGSEPWECAHWDGADWETLECRCVDDGNFEEIGPRIPSPDEPWQCVPVEPTLSMSVEFMDRHNMFYNPSGEDEYRPLHTWKAMLDAAPKP